MRVRCTCNYCGNRFSEYVYDETGIVDIKCLKCGDANVKVIKNEDRDIFGYYKDIDKK